MEKLDLLRSVPMFRGIAESTIEKLAELSSEETFDRGRDIIVQNRRCPFLFVLIDGELGIFLREDGRERQIVRLDRPGRVVGEIGVVSGGNSSATIRVLRDNTRVLKIAENEFQKVVKEDPKLAEEVLRSLVRYL